MKIAFSLQNGKTVSGHAGRCTKFVIYDVQDDKETSKSIVEVDKDGTFHNIFHEGTMPFSDHPLSDVDIIISGSMGAGFVNKMKSQGIKALQIAEKDPDLAMEKLLAGNLEVMAVDHHHGHGHDHNHDHH